MWQGGSAHFSRRLDWEMRCDCSGFSTHVSTERGKEEEGKKEGEHERERTKVG